MDGPFFAIKDKIKMNHQMTKQQCNASLLLLTLILGACSSTAPTPQANPTDTPTKMHTIPISTQTATATLTETPVPARDGIISEVENQVTARKTESEDFAPASIGMTLLPSGGVETGDDGRTRIDLRPDGTIIRVGPSSSFTILVISEEDGQPKTTLELLLGKIFILLSGGSLDVETPSGVASVRGSLLSVTYYPELGRLEAACLEGHCSLKSKDGEEVELTAGLTSFIQGNTPPVAPGLMTREQVQDWLNENPNLKDFLNELPRPENFPPAPGIPNRNNPPVTLPPQVPSQLPPILPTQKTKDLPGNPLITPPGRRQ